MHVGYPPETEPFRSEVRAFIRSSLPEGWTEGVRPEGAALAKVNDDWNRLLHETGWATPTWPERYGGRGLDVLHASIFAEEVAAADAPIQPPAGGELLVGPTILHFGDDALRERYLPPIARGEAVWCQGFSEPGSGSDLASLQTSGRIDGDEVVSPSNSSEVVAFGVHSLQALIAKPITRPRSSKWSRTSWVVSSTSNAPRFGTIVTRPSRSNEMIASRAGIRLHRRPNVFLVEPCQTQDRSTIRSGNAASVEHLNSLTSLRAPSHSRACCSISDTTT